jgi:hypothetical protein
MRWFTECEWKPNEKYSSELYLNILIHNICNNQTFFCNRNLNFDKNIR